MIFVTVGTTLPFDDLIKTIDNLAGNKTIQEPVICQIGNGSYIPQHCEYFRFTPSLDEHIDKADIVVCHGGTGSVLGAIAKGKKFVAVANPLGAEDHQAQFLKQLSYSIPILWTSETRNVIDLIHQARNHEYINHELPCLTNDLREYILTN